MVTHGTVTENRREETRQYYSGLPLTWRKGLSGRWRQGLLHNLSQTGLAIFVPAGGSLYPGQHIELIRKGHPRRVMCKVVRTEEWGENKMLVGAKMTEGDDSLHWLKPGQGPSGERRPLARRKKMSPRASVRLG